MVRLRFEAHVARNGARQSFVGIKNSDWRPHVLFLQNSDVIAEIRYVRGDAHVLDEFSLRGDLHILLSIDQERLLHLVVEAHAREALLSLAGLLLLLLVSLGSYESNFWIDFGHRRNSVVAVLAS